MLHAKRKGMAMSEFRHMTTFFNQTLQISVQDLR